MADTFEEKINDMTESKKELADLTAATGEKWPGDMSNTELNELFALAEGGIRKSSRKRPDKQQVPEVTANVFQGFYFTAAVPRL